MAVRTQGIGVSDVKLNNISAQVESSGGHRLHFLLVELTRFRAIIAGGLLFAFAAAAPRPAPVSIDYPSDGSIFPPEFPAPAFLWRDAAANATEWTIEVKLAGRTDTILIRTRGECPRVGEIDPRAVAPTNTAPQRSRRSRPRRAPGDRMPRPGPAIKQGSVEARPP